MYLSDQLAATAELTNRINGLQMQIEGTYNARMITDFVVSRKPVGPSKCRMLLLLIMASIVFSFFGIFFVNFVKGIKR